MKLVNGFNLFHESSKKIEDSSQRVYISKLDKNDLSINNNIVSFFLIISGPSNTRNKQFSMEPQDLR